MFAIQNFENDVRLDKIYQVSSIIDNTYLCEEILNFDYYFLNLMYLIILVKKVKYFWWFDANQNPGTVVIKINTKNNSRKLEWKKKTKFGICCEALSLNFIIFSTNLLTFCYFIKTDLFTVFEFDSFNHKIRCFFIVIILTVWFN